MFAMIERLCKVQQGGLAVSWSEKLGFSRGLSSVKVREAAMTDSGAAGEDDCSKICLR
jgi:hypothetical protein